MKLNRFAGSVAKLMKKPTEMNDAGVMYSTFGVVVSNLTAFDAAYGAGNQ